MLLDFITDMLYELYKNKHAMGKLEFPDHIGLFKLYIITDLHTLPCRTI